MSNNYNGFTNSERRFLTLNPIEWTRNNYPVFCRMHDGLLSEPEELPAISYKIISIERIRLAPEKEQRTIPLHIDL